MSLQPLALTKASRLPAWTVACLAVLLAVIAFRGTIHELATRWASEEEYSHGFLVPLASAWLLWRRRDALLASIAQPSWTGPVLILAAMFIYIVGQLSAIFVLAPLALIVTLLGISLALGGLSLLRSAFVPVVFLVFAIPLPHFIDANLSLELQLISSKLGASFIRLFQIPVYLEGNVIDLGTYKLQVVEACSGLRYLFPLFSLSFLAAYLFQAPMWQRALLLFSSIPITIGMNGFRIGIVGVTVDRWGPQMADGVLHFFEGWVIFVAAGLLIVLEATLLQRISGARFLDLSESQAPASPKSGRAELEATGLRQLWACLLLICATMLVSPLTSTRSEIVPERSRFVTFPTKIGSWQGNTSLLEPQVEQALAMDDYLLSDYSNPEGQTVNLYAAYYASQRTGKLPHSPLDCIPGDGWSITKFDRTNVDKERPVNRAVIERNGSRQLVYYWYEERGKRTNNEYWSKWYLLYDAITKDRSDGALVRLTTPLRAGELERDADTRLQLFLRDLGSTLDWFLPSAETQDSASAEKRLQPTNIRHKE